MNHPDIHDLGNLLEALRARHTAVYYGAIVLMGLGVLGGICLFDAIFPGAGK